MRPRVYRSTIVGIVARPNRPCGERKRKKEKKGEEEGEKEK